MHREISSVKTLTRVRVFRKSAIGDSLWLLRRPQNCAIESVDYIENGQVLPPGHDFDRAVVARISKAEPLEDGLSERILSLNVADRHGWTDASIETEHLLWDL